MLIALLASALSLAPIAAFAKSYPVHFSYASSCAFVQFQDKEATPADTYTINVRENQSVRVRNLNLNYTAHSFGVTNPKSVYALVGDGQEVYSFRPNYTGTYTLEFYEGDSDAFTPSLSVCIR